MTTAPGLPDLRDAVRAVAAWLVATGVRGALIGGVAVSALGRPRSTRDVDVVVWLPFPKDWPPFVASMGTHGLAFRPGGSLDFAHASRVLLLVHAASGVDVDVSLGALAFEEELILAARTSAGSGLDLALPRPEDLVVLKAVAARPRDLADIEGLLLHNPGIDRPRARALVAALGEALDSPELVRTLDDLFVRVPPRR